MFTLKVITQDFEGIRETHLFSAKRIQHTAIESADYKIEPWVGHNCVTIGSLTQTTDEHGFNYCRVFLYGEEDHPETLLYILPYAECFVTEKGKTVDTFGSYYK